MARAHGSYPWCHWFKSSCRYHIASARAEALRPVGQVVKTPPFHGGNTSSSLVRVTNANTRVSHQHIVLSGGIAQPVERSPHTREVTDSSSVVSTNTVLPSFAARQNGTGGAALRPSFCFSTSIYIVWARSSAGRAPRSQCGGRGFILKTQMPQMKKQRCGIKNIFCRFSLPGRKDKIGSAN